MLKLDDIPLIREGILQRDPPRLLGTECTACGTRSFPVRDFCPACSCDAPPTVPLATTGVVFSFTVVRQAPGNRPVPYVLAFVDLDDQVRVLAQLDHPPQDVGIGMPVRLVLRNVVPEPGEARLGYAFICLDNPDHKEAS